MTEALESQTSRLLHELVVHTPVDPRVPRVRAGAHGDGGYVLLDQGLENLERFYSYGISDDHSFDTWIHRRTGAVGRLFDPTVDYPDCFEGGLHFRKIGLAVSQGTVEDHIKMFGDTGKRMLLKVDVEGCEWDWLSQTTSDQLAIFDHILLELHDLQDAQRHGRYAEALAKINRDFFLVHVHANNFYPLFKAGDWLLPGLLECSYVRKDLMACEVNRSVIFPCGGIDVPNVRDVPELPLDFWPFVSGQPDDIEKMARKSAQLYIEAHGIITLQRRRIKSLKFELDRLEKSALWRMVGPLRFVVQKCRSILGS